MYVCARSGARSRQSACKGMTKVENELSPRDHIVFIVDDDRRICEALSALLSTYDLNVMTFGSATEYIAYPKPDLPACLILDLELPDTNGLELQRQAGQGPPIVFITGHGDI